MREHTLPIMQSLETDFLADGGGKPIWPVRNTSEESELQSLACVFGSTIERSGASSIGSAVPLNDEVVIAYGEGAKEPARLYAHLTGRQYAEAKSFEALKQHRRPAVLVAVLENVTSALLRYLYEPPIIGMATGIVTARSPEALRRQVLLRAATSFLRGPVPSPGRINLFPSLALEFIQSDGHHIIGRNAPPAVIRGALNAVTGLLSIRTHSDGVDAFLGGGLLMCPFPVAFEEPKNDLKPRCKVTNFCHRTKLPLAEALQSDLLVSPSSLSARVFLWNVCWGILPVSGNLAKVINRAWGVMPRLIESSRIGAILTTWQLTISDLDSTQKLEQWICDGRPLGMSLADYLNSATARRTGHRLCLFGDPRVTLPKPAEDFSSAERKPITIFGPPPSRRSVQSKELGQLAFLRSWLTEAVPSSLGAVQQSCRTCLESVQACEHAAWLGLDINCVRPSETAKMREVILEHLSEHGIFISHNWLRLAARIRLLSPSPACFACGSHSNSYAIRLRVPLVSERRITICSYCGVIEDAPIASSLRFSLREGRYPQIEGPLPNSNWAAKLVFGSTLQEDHQAWDWPADPQGKPVKEFIPPEPRPSGPLRVVFVFMHGAELVILQQPGRG